MKRVLVFLCLIFLINAGATGQSARAALEVYEEGPVWHMIYMRTGPGSREAYLDSLSRTWIKQIELAEQMGFVLDHHVLTKWPGNLDDWNVLIIEIFPNMASYDSFWENWALVDAQILPDQRQQDAVSAEVVAKRTMLGVQIAREVFLKPPGTVNQNQ